MAWLHLDFAKDFNIGTRAKVTDDDGDEVAIVTDVRVEYKQEPYWEAGPYMNHPKPGKLEGHCEITLFITDVGKFQRMIDGELEDADADPLAD
jgi:hypothetical protein